MLAVITSAAPTVNISMRARVIPIAASNPNASTGEANSNTFAAGLRVWILPGLICLSDYVAVSYGHGRVQLSCSSHLRAFAGASPKLLQRDFPQERPLLMSVGAGRDRRPIWSSGYGGRDSRHKTQNGLATAQKKRPEQICPTGRCWSLRYISPILPTRTSVEAAARISPSNAAPASAATDPGGRCLTLLSRPSASGADTKRLLAATEPGCWRAQRRTRRNTVL